MKPNRIEVGDKVDVLWERLEPLRNCEIVYTPQATGDSWILKTQSGTIIYVNSFSRMVKQ